MLVHITPSPNTALVLCNSTVQWIPLSIVGSGESHLCRGVWRAPSVRLMMSSTWSTEESISLTTSVAPWVQARCKGVDLSFWEKTNVHVSHESSTHKKTPNPKMVFSSTTASCLLFIIISRESPRHAGCTLAAVTQAHNKIRTGRRRPEIFLLSFTLEMEVICINLVKVKRILDRLVLQEPGLQMRARPNPFVPDGCNQASGSEGFNK